MIIMNKIHKPFIIKGKQDDTLIPKDDPSFDERVEKKVRFT